MKLKQYLTENKIPLEQFAQEIGSSVSGLNKWIYGERVPRPDQQRRIAEVTGGLVEPNDFILPDVEGAE